MDSQTITRASAADEPQDDWYEHGFARVEGSRRRGVASLPLPQAQTLLKWAGFVPGADLAGQLVIDPACGSGNTLLAAASALAARGRARRWGAERVAQEIEHSLWGLDPDPIACHVAELRLRRHIGMLLPDLPATRRKTLQLHLHQTDSLVLPADARFHLVITNPPQASARGMVISYTGFESRTPPRDVWLRFLEQSMRLVAYGGMLAIALPEALLTKPSAAAARAELATEWTIERLAHLTGIFRSGPGAVLLVARRALSADDGAVRWERIERLAVPRLAAADLQSDRPPTTISGRMTRAERRDEGQIAQADLAAAPRGPWRYALGPAERAFVARMQSPAGTVLRQPLGDLQLVERGAELHKDAPEPVAARFPGAVAWLRANDVTAFRADAGRAWLAPAALKDGPDHWRGPKIVLPRSGAFLQAAADGSGAVPAGALIVLTPRADRDFPPGTPAWLLALLNSRPLRAWLALTQTAYLLARPAIDLDALRALPLALGPEDARQRLIGLASEMIRHASDHAGAPPEDEHYPIGQRLRATIDREVAALYGLTPDDLAVVARWGGPADA